MLTIFTYVVFIYAHYFVYAHFFWIWSLFMYILTFFVWPPLLSSPLLSPPTTSSPYLTLCLSVAAHCFHLCPLLLFSLLSSPLLSSFLPMMKVFNSRTYLEYKLIIINLWETWHHYPSPLLSCLDMLTVFGYVDCLYDELYVQMLMMVLTTALEALSLCSRAVRF